MHTFFFNLSSIPAMPLSQTNCNKFFFFILFWHCHCHKFIPTIFFPSILAMALPQTNWNKFVSLLFRHGHNSIPLFFCHKRTWQTKLFRSKKYWKNKNMRTFFLYLSSISAMPLPQTTNFFFPTYSNSFPHFFSLNFGNGIATNYVLFFLFLFIAL